jgi:hypothetical protein
METLPVKSRVGRPTKAVSMDRIREVAAMLLTSRPRSEIIQHCCDNYGIQESSVANIVTNAYKYISETHGHDREGLIVSYVEKYYDVYRMAIGMGDSRGAIQALNSIEKILKLVMPDTAIQNNTFKLDLKDCSIEDLRALLKDNI